MQLVEPGWLEAEPYGHLVQSLSALPLVMERWVPAGHLILVLEEEPTGQ